jgi:hypothetical protein
MKKILILIISLIIVSCANDTERSQIKEPAKTPKVYKMDRDFAGIIDVVEIVKVGEGKEIIFIDWGYGNNEVLGIKGNNLIVFNIADSTEHILLPLEKYGIPKEVFAKRRMFLHFSADRRYIYIDGKSMDAIYDLKEKKVINEFYMKNAKFGSFSPGNDKIIYVTYNESVVPGVKNIKGEEITKQNFKYIKMMNVNDYKETIYCDCEYFPKWHPNKDLILLYSKNDDSLWVSDGNKFKPRMIIKKRDNLTVWRPNYNQLVCYKKGINIFDIDTMEDIELILPFEDNPLGKSRSVDMYFGLSSDGKYIAYNEILEESVRISEEEQERTQNWNVNYKSLLLSRDICITDLDGRYKPFCIKTDKINESFPSWSKDNNMILCHNSNMNTNSESYVIKLKFKNE